MERGKKVPKYTQLPTLGYIWGLNNLLKFTWKGLPHAIMWCSPMWISVPKWKGSLLVYPKQKTKKKGSVLGYRDSFPWSPLFHLVFEAKGCERGCCLIQKRKERDCCLLETTYHKRNGVGYMLESVSIQILSCSGENTLGFWCMYLSSYINVDPILVGSILMWEKGCRHQKHHIPPPYSKPLRFYLWIRKVLR